MKKVKELAQAQYEPELVQIKNGINMAEDSERDPLVRRRGARGAGDQARQREPLLQRKLTIGYARASRMIEQMAADGIVGDYKGSQAREATLTVEEWEELKAAQAAEAEGGEEDADEPAADEEAESGELEDEEATQSEAA